MGQRFFYFLPVVLNAASTRCGGVTKTKAWWLHRESRLTANASAKTQTPAPTKSPIAMAMLAPVIMSALLLFIRYW
jgi:hypothetical protein